MAFELGEDVVDSGARNIHLIKCLHGGKACGTAGVGLLVRSLGRFPGLLFSDLGHDQVRLSRRLIRSMASAARAASPPLSSSPARARAHAWASVSTVMMPL